MQVIYYANECSAITVLPCNQFFHYIHLMWLFLYELLIMFGFVLTPKTILIALFENLRKSETHKLLFSAVQLIVMSCVCVV